MKFVAIRLACYITLHFYAIHVQKITNILEREKFSAHFNAGYSFIQNSLEYWVYQNELVFSLAENWW